MRPILLGMTLCTAVIGAFEALLFAMLGHVVDWLAAVEPAQLWARSAASCCCSAAMHRREPAGRRAAGAVSSTRRWPANFPMRLRWNFHRLMLGQSMSFYQDEFAGRIATKVMQTALAVRDTWMIVGDILVLHRHLLRDHASWCWAASTCGCCCRSSAGWRSTLAALRYFVPRLGRVGAGSRPMRAR